MIIDTTKYNNIYMKKTLIKSLLIALAFAMASCLSDNKKPSIEKIQKDLIGHSLTEGVDSGYYDKSWKWTIEKGQISDFIITDTLVNTDNGFVINAKMKLTNHVNGKAYNATAHIVYGLLNGKKWTIEYVMSEGMSIVKTGKYDKLVEIEKGLCGEGLIVDGYDWDVLDLLKNTCYTISNKGDITIEVGYRKRCAADWIKESIILKPNDSFVVECDNLLDVIIDYVELP